MTAPPRELGVVRLLLGVAVAVSIVHYLDNTLNFAAYPQPSSGPAPSRPTVGLSWLAFTAVAVAAHLLLGRGRTLAAAFGLAVYAGSGLVGIGHYTVPARPACRGGALWDRPSFQTLPASGPPW